MKIMYLNNSCNEYLIDIINNFTKCINYEIIEHL